MTKTAPNARATALDWAHVDDLRPNPRNPRRHGQEVMRLARSILRTAWGAPIVAQRSTKRIIGGHGRLEAAKEIMAGIEVDGELRGGHEHLFDRHAPAPGMVPVRWVDVSDAEADAMTLADNARALQGVDDPLAIVEMAQQFGRESETMRDIGFDAETLDAIVKSAGDAVLSASTMSEDDAFSALPDGEKPPFQSMTFTLHESQVNVVKRALEQAKSTSSFNDSPNENSNGNALACIAEAFLNG